MIMEFERTERVGDVSTTTKVYIRCEDEHEFIALEHSVKNPGRQVIKRLKKALLEDEE